MASTRAALERNEDKVDESMGVRQLDRQPQFSPKPSPKDIGRVPLRTFGQVEVDRVMPDPSQPRSTFDADEIKHLANSIRERGQLHPIRVRWNQEAEKWLIVVGERRWQATKAAGLKTIDCYFVDQELNPSEILEQQLIENLLRQDLRPLEEAEGYARIMDLNGWTGKQVAEALRVSTSKVSRSLALLDLPTEVQGQIERGELPRSAAYEIAKLNDDDVQRNLAAQAASQSLTQKQTAAAVRQRRGKATKPNGIKQTFSADNGLNVTVTARGNATYHEVEEALLQSLEEVRLRIGNNVQLF